MADNFAWTITDENGNLLAYQEKGIDNVEIIDDEGARKRCKKLIDDTIDNVMLDYQLQMQQLGYILYTYRKLIGLDVVTKKKSSLLVPDGKGGYK